MNQPLPPDDPGSRLASQRKALLYRAALACVLMLLLVVGISVYDDVALDSAESQPTPSLPEARESPSESSPALPEAFAPATPPDAVMPSEPAYAPAQGDDRPQDEVPEAGLTSEIAPEAGLRLGESFVQAPVPIPAEPSGTVAALPTHTAVSSDHGPAPAASDPPPAAAAEQPEQTADRLPAATAPAAARAQPSSGARRQVQPALTPAEHMLRLSAPLSPGEAVQMRDAILAAGHAARLQWRVLVGPYATEALARDAMLRLSREQAQRGFVIPLGDAGHGVQLGLFAMETNADRLQQRVQAWGYPVMRDVRVLIGPYPDAAAAATAAVTLGQALGLKDLVLLSAP